MDIVHIEHLVLLHLSVTATAWAITRICACFVDASLWLQPCLLLPAMGHGLPYLALGGRQLALGGRQLALGGRLSLLAASPKTAAAILPMAHAAGCDMSHLSSGATVAS